MADRTLTVKIVGDESDLLRSFQRSSRATQKFSVGIGSILKGAAIGAGITAAVTGVTAALRAGVSEFSEMTKVAAQTNAVLKSTGGIANVTARDVDTLANSISEMSGIDDEVVKSAENMLLTFKNVRNELGKNNQVFDRATKAAADLSVAGFGDMSSTAKQLGKALNDPVKGVTALSRAGITFTKEQLKTIKTLAQTNRVLDAQKIILREVESQVGGSAKALGRTLPGQLNKLRNTLRNTAGALVGKLAPAFETALKTTNEFIGRIGEARTVRAKLNVVFEGIEAVGRQLFGALEDMFKRVDWPRLIEDVQTGLLDGLEAMAKALGKIDFGAVGDAIGKGLVRSLNGIAAFLRTADFELIGRTIVDSIVNFLRNVDWVAVIRGVIVLLAAAVRATVSLTIGIGKALAANLIDGLTDALAGLGSVLGDIFRGAMSELKRVATEVALAIIEPFTHLPSVLGESFRDAKDALERGLRDMNAAAANITTGPNAGPSTARTPARGNESTTATLRRQPITVDTTVVLDGEPVGRTVTKQQQKQRNRNGRQKRGPNSAFR